MSLSVIDNETQITQLSKSIPKCKSTLHKKEKCFLQHKLLSNLINVYQHKIHNISSNKHLNVSFSSKKKLPPLIYNNNSNSNSNKRLSESLSLSSLNKGTACHKVKESEKLRKRKQLLEIQKRERAKEYKEQMNVMKNNLKIFKNSIMCENRNKRNVVKCAHEVEKDSISMYKIEKKNYINVLNEVDVENITKMNKQKMNLFYKLKRKYMQAQNTYKNNSNYNSSSNNSSFVNQHIHNNLNSTYNEAKIA